jgi:hypothetical protein
MSHFTDAPIGHVQERIDDHQKPLSKETRERYYKNYESIFKPKPPAGDSNQQPCCEG